jgi:serine/threonine-protein kinase
MAAARLEIEEALLPGDTSAAPISSAPTSPDRRRWVVWTAAGAAVVLLAISTAILTYSWTRTPSSRGLRLAANLGFDGHVPFGLNGTIALAPDGRAMAFVGQVDGENQPRLYYRSLDQLSARVLPDSEAPLDPVFSPDGQWIAFFSSGKLKKVSIAGGAAVPLADVQTARGLAWGEDNILSFTPDANAGGKIMRVAAAGGAAFALGPAPEGHATQRWPQALPGNAALLYTGHDNVDNFENACLVVHPLPAGPPRIVHCGGSSFRYVASGHVLYVHRGTLFALPFDLRSLSASGTAFPVVEGVLSNPASGAASFSTATDGTLAYVPGQSAGEAGLDIIDRSGRVTRLPLAPQNWQSMSFSPDGRRLAIEIGATGQSDIWVYELARDTLTRLTFSNVPDISPLWTPDGRRIVYASAQGGPPNIFMKSADGSGEERRVSQSDIPQFPQSFDPTGRRLIISGPRHQGPDLDLSLMTMDGDVASGVKGSTPQVLVSTPANEALGVVSPDGQWLAYASDGGGRYEIYVRALDDSGGRWQISTTGGVWPLWSRSRPELVYATIEGQVMVVKYDAAGSFRASRAESWGAVPIMVRSAGWPFALHPDGDRIVASTVAGQPDARVRRFVLVTDFFDELRSRAGK